MEGVIHMEKHRAIIDDIYIYIHTVHHQRMPLEGGSDYVEKQRREMKISGGGPKVPSGKGNLVFDNDIPLDVLLIETLAA